MSTTTFARVASLVVSLLGAAESAGGQAGASLSAPGAGQCVPVVPETVEGFVHGLLIPESPDATIRRGTLAMALASLSSALANDTLTLEPVARLGDVFITAVGRKPDPRPVMMPRWAGHPALMTEVAFTLNQQGQLTDPKIIFGRDPVVAAILLRGIAAVNTVGGAVPDRPERLRLRLTLAPDSAAVSAPLIAAKQVKIVGTPPRFVAGLEGAMTPGWGPRGMEAVVVAWYDIDAKGAVIPASITVAPSAELAFGREYQRFMDAVKRAAPRLRHEPATAGGCPIVHRAIMTVTFRIQREMPPRPQ